EADRALVRHRLRLRGAGGAIAGLEPARGDASVGDDDAVGDPGGAVAAAAVAAVPDRRHAVADPRGLGLGRDETLERRVEIRPGGLRYDAAVADLRRGPARALRASGDSRSDREGHERESDEGCAHVKTPI